MSPYQMILTPPTYYDLTGVDGPVFFLAGPVEGGGDWQKTCYEELCKLHPTFVAAIPYYGTDKQKFPLLEHAYHDKTGDTTFLSQLDWERHYLKKAANDGCIIFWLPEESKTSPRLVGPYASDTRGEIARWSVEQKYNPGYRIVVGAEAGFYGLRTIQRNWNDDRVWTPSERFYDTLLETTRRASLKAREQ